MTTVSHTINGCLTAVMTNPVRNLIPGAQLLDHVVMQLLLLSAKIGKVNVLNLTAVKLDLVQKPCGAHQPNVWDGWMKSTAIMMILLPLMLKAMPSLFGLNQAVVMLLTRSALILENTVLLSAVTLLLQTALTLTQLATVLLELIDSWKKMMTSPMRLIPRMNLT